jgi:flagellar biosynthetic protein FliR
MASPWLFGGMLVFLRVVGLMLAVPFFGSENMPNKTRVVLALALSVAINAGIGLAVVEMPTDILMTISLALRELLIGTALGFMVRLLIAAVEAGGAVAGISMGLSLSALLDIESGEQQIALGRLLGLATILMFFALGGHLVMTASLFEHFAHFPVGEPTFLLPSLDQLADTGAWFIRTATLIASPIIVVALILNLLMGFIMRVVPSLNIFGIGIGILMIGGFIALGSQGESLLVWLGREIDVLPQRMFEFAGGAG